MTYQRVTGTRPVQTSNRKLCAYRGDAYVSENNHTGVCKDCRDGMSAYERRVWA